MRGSPCRRRLSPLGRLTFLIGFSGDERAGRRVRAVVRVAARRVVAVPEPLQRVLALDDAGEAVAALRLDEVVEPARLLDVLRHVWREGDPGLVVADEAHRELHLLDRGDDA